MINKLFLNDKFILILIFINALILFLEGFITQTNLIQLLLLCDHAITMLFILEFVIKAHHFGFAGYFKSNWNKLDFTLVALSLPALITFVFSLDIADVSFLLVFRVLRVFKTFRFFKFIPNANHLVKGIQRALKTSVFVLIGFTIYIFIIGILSYYLFQGNSSHFFSNPLTALYSTFKIFTVEGWFDIPDKITAEYNTVKSFFTYIYFMFVVLTGGILGLSLVNSVFVDSMVSDNNDELLEKVEILDKKLTELLGRENNSGTGN